MTIKRSLYGTRDIGALATRAMLQPDSVNAEKRTVEVVFATPAPVLRSNWQDGQFYEVLSLDAKHVNLDRLNNGAPFLADHRGHDLGAVIGVVESARLEGGKGVATVRFASAGISPEADRVFALVKDGVVANVSVGYRISKMEKVETGDAVIPTFRATAWQPFEISAVPIGADDGAGFRSSDNKPNPCTFLSLSQETNQMDPEEIKRLAAEAEAKATAQRAIDTAAAVKGERERISGITSAFRSFGATAPAHADKLAEMLKGETTLEAARSYVLEELAKVSDDATEKRGTGIERGADDSEQFARGIIEAQLQRVPEVVQAMARGAKGFEKMGDGGSFRGMRLSDIARVCAERNGHNVKGVYNIETILKLALKTRDGYATPSDFPVLFEDIARKSMRAGYALQSDSWRRWVGTDSVPDFKDSSRYQTGSLGTLPVVAPGAEYQNLALPDGAKLVINTETRGGIIAIGRHAIVNDDLGALTGVAAEFGKMSANSIEAACYALLALNSGLGPTITRAGVTAAFFDNTAWANVSTGAALSGAALSLDRAKMRQQSDISGNHKLDITPRILLIALPLEDAAKAINTDTFDHDSTKVQKNNQMRGMFSDIVTKPIAPVLTGTKRYLFTENKEAFKVVFLEGSGEGPTLSSEEGFRTDGVSYKTRIDFKAQAYDPKMAIHNVGQ